MELILQNTFDVSTLLGSNLRLALEHSVFPMDSKVIFKLLKLLDKEIIKIIMSKYHLIFVFRATPGPASSCKCPA